MSNAVLFRRATNPLRDWLRTAALTDIGARVYAGGPSQAALATGTVQVAVERVGGFTEGVYDRALFQFDVWGIAESGGPERVEAAAMALASFLESQPAGTQVASGLVLEGASVESALWLPDPVANTPRFVLTVELSLKATA